MKTAGEAPGSSTICLKAGNTIRLKLIIYFLVFQLSVAEVELRAAAEERDRLLNDANYSSLQNDEAVAKARQERDEAMERKKAAEVTICDVFCKVIPKMNCDFSLV